jgi:hypothetical protein
MAAREIWDGAIDGSWAWAGDMASIRGKGGGKVHNEHMGDI